MGSYYIHLASRRGMYKIHGGKISPLAKAKYQESASEVRKAVSKEGLQNVRIPTVAQNVIVMNWIVELLLCCAGVSSTTVIENMVVRPFSENAYSQIKSKIEQITESRVKCGRQGCDGFFAKNKDYCGKCGTCISSDILPRHNVTGAYEKGLNMVCYRLVEKSKSLFKEYSQYSKIDTISNWCVLQVKQRKGVFVDNLSVWRYAGVNLIDAFFALESMGLDTSEILRLKGDSWYNKSGKKKTCFRTVVFASCDGIEVAVDEAFIGQLQAEKIPFSYQPSAEFLGMLN